MPPRRPTTGQPEDNDDEQKELVRPVDETLHFLQQELDEDLVSTRETGENRGARYIEGWQAIEQANEAFGYGGWSYDLVDVRRETTLGGREFYAAIVRVHALGVTREDTGVSIVEIRRDAAPETARPASYETARKGAVTDALKRALRGFGPQFGNALYGDGWGDEDEDDPKCPLHGVAWFRTRRGDAHKFKEDGIEKWCNPWQGYAAEIRAAGKDLPDERKAAVFRELNLDRAGYKEWSAADCERLIKGLEDEVDDGGQLQQAAAA